MSLMWQISGRLRTTGDVTLFPCPNQKFWLISAKNFKPITCSPDAPFNVHHHVCDCEIELGFMEIYGNLWAFMGISNPQLSHFPFESHFFGNVPPFSPHNLGDPLVIKCGWKTTSGGFWKESSNQMETIPAHHVWWHRRLLLFLLLYLY